MLFLSLEKKNNRWIYMVIKINLSAFDMRWYHPCIFLLMARCTWYNIIW